MNRIVSSHKTNFHPRTSVSNWQPKIFHGPSLNTTNIIFESCRCLFSHTNGLFQLGEAFSIFAANNYAFEFSREIRAVNLTFNHSHASNYKIVERLHFRNAFPQKPNTCITDETAIVKRRLRRVIGDNPLTPDRYRPIKPADDRRPANPRSTVPKGKIFHKESREYAVSSRSISVRRIRISRKCISFVLFTYMYIWPECIRRFGFWIESAKMAAGWVAFFFFHRNIHCMFPLTTPRSPAREDVGSFNDLMQTICQLCHRFIVAVKRINHW